MQGLNHYDTFIFDCDGVLLDSNRIKTEAIRETLASRLSAEQVDAAIDHHVKNGGTSRYEKFQLYVGTAQEQACLWEYADKIRISYLTCGTIPYVKELLDCLPDSSKRIVVSGGNQVEVVRALRSHSIRSHFDVILGSPTTKLDNCESLGRLGKTVYFGDSELDFHLAEEMGWDFVFVYGATEFAEWATFFADKGILLIEDFMELVE